MYEKIPNKFLLAFAILAMVVCFAPQQPLAFGQEVSKAQNLSELRRLRDELKLSDSLRNADVVLMVSEHKFFESAGQLVGLEIVLSNGSVLRVTSVEGELKPAAAIVRIGVQARSSVTVNLQLTGRLGTGEVGDGVFRIPFKITEVTLMNGRFSSLLLKTLFGEWLTSQKWNQELPPLEIPLETGETMQIPANRFNVEGSMPMEIITPAYQAPLKFALTSFLVLDKRVVLALRMIQNSRAAENRYQVVQASYPGTNDNDLTALTGEIARLSENLVNNGDLRVRLNRRVISALLEQIAAAHKVDFNIRLKPGRIRAEEASMIVNVLNYTDVEGGEGHADVSQMSIESIAGSKVHLRLSGQGEIDARLRGREYGIPYRLSPRTTFVINNQIVPLQFVSEGERVMLQAVPGATLPISVRFILKVAGRDIGINRNVVMQADRWLNRIELPAFLDREIPVPRKLEVDAGGNLYVTNSQKLNYGLSKLRVIADNDAVDIIADVKLTPR